MYLSLSYNPLLTGPPPTGGFTSWTGQCTTALTGTSLGLDEPMIYILRNISAALDPTGAKLPSWKAPGLQPCQNYGAPAGGTTQGTSGYNERLGYGLNFAGISCASTGGISAVYLRNYGLNGTVPYELVRRPQAHALPLFSCSSTKRCAADSQTAQILPAHAPRTRNIASQC